MLGGGACLPRWAERGQELPLTKPPPLLQLALPLGGRRYAGPGRPGERRLILSGQRSGRRSCLWPPRGARCRRAPREGKRRWETPRKLTDDKRETEAGGSSGVRGGGSAAHFSPPPRGRRCFSACHEALRAGATGREGRSESKAGQGGRAGGEKRAASRQGKDGMTSEESAPIGRGSFRLGPPPAQATRGARAAGAPLRP